MNKKCAFVMNRLDSIKKLCEKHPIEFGFIKGHDNPSDAITRCVSYKMLLKSNYWAGPSLDLVNGEDEGRIIVPNSVSNDTIVNIFTAESELKEKHLFDTKRANSFRKITNIYYFILFKNFWHFLASK